MTKYNVRLTCRGGGKTSGFALGASEYCNLYPNSTVAYFSPTFGMGLRSWWREMDKINDGMPGVRSDRSEYFWQFQHTNSRALLLSLDDPKKVRGNHPHLIFIDEAQMLSMEDFRRVIFPMAQVHNARIVIAGTADYSDNLLYEAYQRAIDPQRPNWSQQTWDCYSIGIWTKEYIEREIRPEMTEEEFLQEYECRFVVSTENLVFKPFTDKNSDTTITYNPRLPIQIGMDFNVNPMTAALFQEQSNGHLHFFDEIVLSNSNTEETCEEIRSRYPDAHDITVHPDQSGGSRRTAGTISEQSDHAVIRRFRFRVRTRPQGNPPVLPSIRAVNTLICNANSQRRVFINPERCPQLVRALKTLKFKPKSSIVDKRNPGNHIADAFRYGLHFYTEFAGLKTASVQEMVL